MLNNKQQQETTHCILVFAEKFGAGQKLFIFTERDDRLRQLSQVQLQQGCHGVNVCVTAEKQEKNRHINIKDHTRMKS